MTDGIVARAAVLRAPRHAEVVGLHVRDANPDEVVVEVDGCGVCGSNLPLWQGREWFDYPREPGAPGHEGWGRVADVGPEVDGVVTGARVAFLSDAAFASTVVVPASAVVVLPSDFPDQPFPGEALGCAFNVATRSGFTAGQTVAVVGSGFLGALVVRLAASAGARVLAVSRRAFSLDVAERMGAAETISVDDMGSAVELVTKLTDGELCDVVVEATGLQAPLDLAGELTKVRGRLVVAGFHQDGRRSVDLQLWNWRGIDVVNAHERDDGIRLDGIRRAADAIARGTLDPSPLYTHEFPLAKLGAAMDLLESRPDGFVKALVSP